MTRTPMADARDRSRSNDGPPKRRPPLLVFGAGNIGLSFVGQIFARSGYEVIFADANPTVVKRLNDAGGYTTRLLSPDGSVESHRIAPVRAIDATDTNALTDVIARRPLIATAVGARAFPIVLRTLASAAARAPVPVGDLDLIAVENIHDPRTVARRHLGADTMPGVHACSVGKMVPLQSLGDSGPIEVRCEAFNTLIVDATDWRTPFPEENRWLKPVGDIGAWMDRKLYVHNLGHAVCAWRARSVDREIDTIAAAIANPQIRAYVTETMVAAAATVGLAYPDAFSRADLEAHVADLIYRFGSVALGDTVDRVGRDVVRKLGRDERVIGAMRLAARLTDAPDRTAVPPHGSQHGPGALLARCHAIVRDALAFEPMTAATPFMTVAGLDANDPVDRRVIDALARDG